MSNVRLRINKLLVQLFNDVVHIEEKSLQGTDYINLSITEIHTLEAVGDEGGRTMGEIAHDLRITVGALTTAMNKLVKKGYVKRERSEKDRRKVYISLTSSGKDVCRIHKQFHDEMIDYMLKGFSEGEEDVLYDALVKATEFFERKYNSLF